MARFFAAARLHINLCWSSSEHPTRRINHLKLPSFRSRAACQAVRSFPREKSLVPKCSGKPRGSPDVQAIHFRNNICEFESYMVSAGLFPGGGIDGKLRLARALTSARPRRQPETRKTHQKPEAGYRSEQVPTLMDVETIPGRRRSRRPSLESNACCLYREAIFRGCFRSKDGQVFGRQLASRLISAADHSAWTTDVLARRYDRLSSEQNFQKTLNFYKSEISGILGHRRAVL